jgi:hypothetical protein
MFRKLKNKNWLPIIANGIIEAKTTAPTVPPTFEAILV